MATHVEIGCCRFRPLIESAKSGKPDFAAQRDFCRTAAAPLDAAVVARLNGRPNSRTPTPGQPVYHGESPMAVSLKVNGAVRSVPAEPDTPLLYVLRNDLELNSAKFGCGLSQCGACTVL